MNLPSDFKNDLKSTLKIKNRRGDMSLILIIFLVIIIIALVVWYAFWGKPKATTTSSNSTSSSITATPAVKDPYADWKAYTLKYEKINLKYPSDWKLTDESQNDSTIGGIDRVSFLSPDGFEITVNTNVMGIGGSCEDCKTYETSKEKILGDTTGVNLYGNDKGVYGLGLARSDGNGSSNYVCSFLCSFQAKNSQGLVMISGRYKLTDAETRDPNFKPKTFSVETFKNDTNVKDAKLVFSSMTY